MHAHKHKSHRHHLEEKLHKRTVLFSLSFILNIHGRFCSFVNINCNLLLALWVNNCKRCGDRMNHINIWIMHTYESVKALLTFFSDCKVQYYRHIYNEHTILSKALNIWRRKRSVSLSPEMENMMPWKIKEMDDVVPWFQNTAEETMTITNGNLRLSAKSYQPHGDTMLSVNVFFSFFLMPSMFLSFQGEIQFWICCLLIAGYLGGRFLVIDSVVLLMAFACLHVTGRNTE